MSLSPEWRGRIEMFREALKAVMYRELGEAPMAGFATREQLSPAEALRKRFKPMRPGEAWGEKWGYGWFRARIRLPAAAAGMQIILRPDVGAESRVRIDGREAGGRDGAHADFPLGGRGVAGRICEVLIEGYAGHGQTACTAGPIPEGGNAAARTRAELTIPDPPFVPKRLGRTTFGIWEEEVWQLWLDVETLLQVRDRLDADSLRVAEIDEALRRFTVTADLELPYEAMMQSVRAARRALRPVLRRRNGPTMPEMICFGHSHIDVAWLWPLAETERKCARTFATQLELMRRYPEFRFMQSQPHLYRMTANLYPDIYRRIKQAAKAGQWMPEGAMWVEPDTNISSGESLIRQCLHGKRFFKREFGVESRLLWLPDVFGYSGALPQILAGCGVPYFSTSKIFWTYNGGDQFPLNTFWWEGIDGTRILAHIHNDYNSRTDPAAIISRWNERVQKDGIASRIVPFGHGDGGGGPTREHLEFLRRQRDLEGVPRTRIASPIEFFERERKRKAGLPVYVGELYFQAHRGTYTTQARTKKGNRRSEFALREAEMWSAAAQAGGGRRYPAKAMDEAWKGVLLNQFHDILPGSSIARVYEEAEAHHRKAQAEAARVAVSAGRSLLKTDRNAVTVFNSLSWPREALVPMPKGFAPASVPAQTVDGTTYAAVSLPPCGWTSLKRARRAAAVLEKTVRATSRSLENQYVRVKFNDRGEVVSFADKESGREFAAGVMNRFRMYKDVPRWFDAWDIDSNYALMPVALDGAVKIRVIASGPLAGVIEVRRRLNRSELRQRIWLEHNSRRLEFRTTIEWQEQHKLLKVDFPVAVHSNEALHEIQFGHIRRPTHRSRPYDAHRFEVAQQKWTALAEEKGGAAVLNDCKYGVSTDGNTISLTLLRAAMAPDWTADRGRQEFTYAFYAWAGPMAESRLVREAYELNIPPMTVAGAAGVGAMLSVTPPNVVVEAVKPAEDGSGDVVVRVYEAMRSAADGALRAGFPVKRAWECDLLENKTRMVKARGDRIRLKLRPFEIKTLRLTPA